MPSLRELLGLVRDCDKLISPETKVLLEALVEAVEPGDTPTDEEYNDVRDDQIRFLQKELAEASRRLVEARAAWGQLEASLREQLAEAKAEIENLSESRRWWKQRAENEAHETTRLHGITSAQGPRIKELVAEIKLLRHELAEAKAEIARLKEQRESWQRKCRNAERGLAKTKFTIEQHDVELTKAWATVTEFKDACNCQRAIVRRLKRMKAGLYEELEQAHIENDEAKAEMERLEKNCDYLHQQVTRARIRRAELCRQLTEVRVELESYTESVNVDAEIGRLVRGMRRFTRLERSGTLYWSACIPLESMDSEWEYVIGHLDDPAEALRAIQQVGDGEA